MAEPYFDAMMRRLGIVDSMGADVLANTQQLAAQRMQAQSTPSGFSGPDTRPMGAGSYSPTGAGNNFQSFMNAIARLESGGNYGAINSSSGATGRYQIMPANIGPWSQMAIGHSVSRNQFLNSPQIQEQVARFMLGKYYNQYGPYGAAQAWYGGPGGVGKGYTSAYALKILRFMG